MDDTLRAALINAAVASHQAVVAGYKADNRRRAQVGDRVHYDVEFGDAAAALDDRVAEIMAMDREPSPAPEPAPTPPPGAPAPYGCATCHDGQLGDFDKPCITCGQTPEIPF